METGVLGKRIKIIRYSFTDLGEKFYFCPDIMIGIRLLTDLICKIYCKRNGIIDYRCCC